MGLTTLPALMHEVQTYSRFGVPSTRARTRWMFGFQRRLVRRCECETLMPHEGPFPHRSQTAAMVLRLLGEIETSDHATSG